MVCCCVWMFVVVAVHAKCEPLMQRGRVAIVGASVSMRSMCRQYQVYQGNARSEEKTGKCLVP